MAGGFAQASRGCDGRDSGRRWLRAGLSSIDVQQIVRKHGLQRDPEVQTLEDALCLVFLETQLGDLRRDHGDEKVHEILVKTLKKMSDRAKELALELEMPAEDRELLERAVEIGS